MTTSAGSTEPRPDTSEPRPDTSEPRPAATVILLRDSADGIQTWLLRRVRAMAFAGGMTVFPGGRVDAADADAVPWAGPPPADVARRFGCTVEQARSYVVAGVRETFEEAGVLLTHPPHSVAEEGWLAARRAEIESHQLGFAQFLADRALAVDGALLHPWARWITPPAESRRYDTHFFVAALPEGASAITGTTEATHLEWLRPTDALAEFAAGTRPLLPPTMLTLRELAGFDRVQDVLDNAAGRSLEAVRPVFHRAADGQATVTMPDGSVHDVPSLA